jgi:hypothetical protein
MAISEREYAIDLREFSLPANCITAVDSNSRSSMHPPSAFLRSRIVRLLEPARPRRSAPNLTGNACSFFY